MTSHHVPCPRRQPPRPLIRLLPAKTLVLLSPPPETPPQVTPVCKGRVTVGSLRAGPSPGGPAAHCLKSCVVTPLPCLRVRGHPEVPHFLKWVHVHRESLRGRRPSLHASARAAIPPVQDASLCVPRLLTAASTQQVPGIFTEVINQHDEATCRLGVHGRRRALCVLKGWWVAGCAAM